MKRPPTKTERKKEKEKKVIMTAPQETIVILKTNSCFSVCVGVCVRACVCVFKEKCDCI